MFLDPHVPHTPATRVLQLILQLRLSDEAENFLVRLG